MDKKCCREGNVLLRVIFPVFIMSLLGAGCASYNAQTQKISQSYELGNIQAAASQISAEADKRGEGKDAVVWRLEQGAVLRAAGRLEDSNRAFDKAEELVNKYEEAAKTSVSREALAAVTNLTTLPYEGFAYDKIMMNTYKALNYLQMGDSEKARVEFNRAFQRQDDAVHINEKRIEKAIEEGNKQNYNIDLEKINYDRKFKSQFDNYYGDLEQFEAYAAYVNPLTVYLDGLYFMTNATGGSDLEHASKSFERVLGMIGENKYIRQDMEILQQVVNGKPIPATTYVFFETGQSPEREQIRIDLPLFIITPGVPYVGAAFPKLKYRSDYISALNVSYSGKAEAALLLSNMDAVIAQEFKNELPTVITKTLIASAIKAGTTYGAYTGVTSGGRKNTGAGLAVLIAGAIYQAAMNQADLRTWTTLPKEFQFCRFPTPNDRKIELESPFSGYKLPVSINDGLINVVWVKSVNRGSPLLVSQFKLKDETKGAAISPPPEAAAPKEVPQQEPPTTEQPPRMQQPEASKPEQTVQPQPQGSSKPEQETHTPQTEPSKTEQADQFLQKHLKPEETSQENKLEVTTEQSVQSSPQESSKSELSTQESPPAEDTKPEEPIWSDNNQSSVPKEVSLQEPPKTEKQHQVHLIQAIQRRQLETSKLEQSIQTQDNEGPSLIGVGLPDEKITAQIEAERISKIGKTMLKKTDPLLTKLCDSMDNNNWNMVIQTGKELIEIDPENFLANFGLGMAYAILNEFELSLQYFKKANQLIPSSVGPFWGMTLVYARKGDKDQAIESLKFAIDRGYSVTGLKNDPFFPEDFRNDPRLDNFIR